MQPEPQAAAGCWAQLSLAPSVAAGGCRWGGGTPQVSPSSPKHSPPIPRGRDRWVRQSWPHPASSRPVFCTAGKPGRDGGGTGGVYGVSVGGAGSSESTPQLQQGCEAQRSKPRSSQGLVLHHDGSCATVAIRSAGVGTTWKSRSGERRRDHPPAWVLPAGSEAASHRLAGYPCRHPAGHSAAGAGTHPAEASQPAPLTPISAAGPAGVPAIPPGDSTAPRSRTPGCRGDISLRPVWLLWGGSGKQFPAQSLY